MFKKIIIVLALLIIPLSIVAIAPVQAGSVSLTNPLQSQGISSLFNSSTYIGKVIGRVLGIIGSVSLLLLIYGGFLMIMSGGSESKVKEGKSIITYTAIGLVVIFSAYIILTFFLGALGGNLYDEYYDMPGGSGSVENIEESASCPVDCNTSLSCNEQEPYCKTSNCCIECPLGCNAYESCIGANQPTDCLDTPGCCGMTQP